MRIFVYEFVTGGGFLGEPGAPLPSGSLLIEGFGMAVALAADFAEVGTCQVRMLQDARLPDRFHVARTCANSVVYPVSDGQQHDQLFRKFSSDSDWTVVIAPEIGGNLARCCGVVEAVGGRLLGPGTKNVRWTSNKQQTAMRLHAMDVPAPGGVELSARELCDEQVVRTSVAPWAGDRPVVIKPIDGAGSWRVRQFATLSGMGHRYMRDIGESVDDRQQTDQRRASRFRVEEYMAGRAASVAMLLGPGGATVLQPCWQDLSDDGWFVYRGGCVMSAREEAAQAARARRLAQSVARLLHPDVGYVGIDCVLAEDATQRDAIIEINPRLTSSYLGLRRATDMNLAYAMLAVARGEQVDLVWQESPMAFGIA